MRKQGEQTQRQVGELRAAAARTDAALGSTAARWPAVQREVGAELAQLEERLVALGSKVVAEARAAAAAAIAPPPTPPSASAGPKSAGRSA